MIPRPFVRCTFAVSHETHENGPLRPRRLPVGSSPVSDGWRLCGALWRGWRIESPLGIRGGGGRASACPSASGFRRFGSFALVFLCGVPCGWSAVPAALSPVPRRSRWGGCGCPDGFGAGGVRSPLRWLPLACGVSACPRWLSPVLRSASAASRFGRAASGRPAEKRSGAPRQECAACRFVRCGRWLGNCRKDCVLEVFTPLHVLGVAVLKSRVYGFPNYTGYLTYSAYCRFSICCRRT